MPTISTHFHSGNIDVKAQDGDRFTLAIRWDAGEEHRQWFHYRVTGAKGRALTMTIDNARECSYPDAWDGYTACASYDHETWFRVDTVHKDGDLTITHTPEHDSVHYAYFAPYDEARHQRTVGRLQQREGVSLEVLGQTLDGRDLDLVTVAGGKLPLWVIGRQHPGESMAEWLIEGLLERLTDPADALARQLREKATFYVVPNMNPDGSARGHLRCNASGANLNREWAEPTMARSPEVKLVRDKMDQTGLRFCLDVHGDEELPVNFISGADGVLGLDDVVVGNLQVYCDALVRACPDFQTERGYPIDAPGEANMTMATNHLAGRFNALCMTLEQPFKDSDITPMPDEGWSPRRCMQLGRAQLDAIAAVIDTL